MPNRSIFIVEDDPDILELMEICLAEEGFEVMGVSDISGLEKKIRAVPPALVFLDLWIQGGDSSGIVKKLKSDPKTAAIPIVLVSAHPKLREAAEKAGADGILEKPFDVNNLSRMARGFLK